MQPWPWHSFYWRWPYLPSEERKVVVATTGSSTSANNDEISSLKESLANAEAANRVLMEELEEARSLRKTPSFWYEVGWVDIPLPVAPQGIVRMFSCLVRVTTSVVAVVGYRVYPRPSCCPSQAREVKKLA